jgi:hypothetical protein
LVLRLHAAWSGHYDKIAASDLDPVHANDRLLGFGLSADQLVPFLDRQDSFNLRKGGQGFQSMMGPLITNRSDDCLKLSVDWVRGITEFLDFQDDFFDLFLGCFGLEDDNHEKRSRYHIPFDRKIEKARHRNSGDRIQEIEAWDLSFFDAETFLPVRRPAEYVSSMDNLAFPF